MMINITYDMEANIQIFSSPQFGQIRTAGTSEQPLFCLVDLCKILDLGNPSQVKSRLSDGVISNEGISDSLGRMQQALFVNEDGLYDTGLPLLKKSTMKLQRT